MPFRIALAALLVTLAAPAPAQEARPRVSLTLSGGGARGLAHVGALQELERMRIPVDLVTATSMGAVIGGLWASGLSADSIAAVGRSADWPSLLADAPPRGSLDFRHRAAQRRYGLEMDVGVGGRGLRLPGGLVSGQELGLLWRRLLFPVLADDRLPIPFVAVATDYERGVPVLLDGADPAEALRASMAIPLVFTPVQRGDTLLVDGGLVNNLPVDVALARGAEFAIAVDATPKLKSGEAVRSLFGAMDQLAAFIGRADVDEHRALTDVAIIPDLEGVSLFDFERGEEIAALGAAATRARTADLAALAVDSLAYAAWRESLRPDPLPATLAAVRVDGPDWLDERRVFSRIDLVPGDPLTPESLERAARATYALGEFERVEYDLEPVGDGVGAVIRPLAPPWGAHSLRFGARLVTDSGGADLRTGNVAFTLRAAWRRARLNARGGELWVEGSAGQETGIGARLRQPLDWGGRWFVEPSAGVANVRQPLFDDERPVAEYSVTRMEAGFDVGRSIGGSAEARVGLRRGRVDARTRPGDSDLLLPAVEDDLGALVVAVAVDRLDDADFPRRGLRTEARWWASREGLGGHANYDRVDVSAAAFGSRGPWTAFVSGQATSGLHGDLPAWDQPRLGGILSLSGYGEGELRGDDAVVLRAGLLRRLFAIPPARGVYAGGWVEAGNAWAEIGDPSLEDLERAATLALVVDTGLGPVTLGWGHAGGHRNRAYLAVGASF